MNRPDEDLCVAREAVDPAGADNVLVGVDRALELGQGRRVHVQGLQGLERVRDADSGVHGGVQGANGLGDLGEGLTGDEVGRGPGAAACAAMPAVDEVLDQDRLDELVDDGLLDQVELAGSTGWMTSFFIPGKVLVSRSSV
ncbi:hypothetical protein [Streptomyces peucetius]|uniref:Uncharacterized protein n=1 Tax=Streptomyces peucetius TaxID=1950 RepID=A0ABY6II37_STRPE|nr:hypothetical protein [Streptomyces peucetius]UYQ65365.1 hypothetical protein OGH68_30470 [Streptomyces peucetius]